mgnify:CR=1 FL=1
MVLQAIDQHGGVRLDHHHRAHLGTDEAARDAILDERHEWIKVACRVQHADRLAMDAELLPRDDLEQLLHHTNVREPVMSSSST